MPLNGYKSFKKNKLGFILNNSFLNEFLISSLLVEWAENYDDQQTILDFD